MDGRETLHRITTNLQAVIKGKPEVTELVVTALCAGGHILIEDVPGVGKTTLCKALARSISGSSSPEARIDLSSLPKSSHGPTRAWNIGLMPNRSRQSTSRRRSWSATQMANMPERRSTNASPWRR